MKTVDETKQFFVFDPDNAPAAYAQNGDTIQFTCQDCWQNMLTDESKKKSDYLAAGNELNPVNGPVFIEDAEPGDTLKIHIDSIELIGNTGGMAFNIPHLGILGQFFTEERTVLVPIEDGIDGHGWRSGMLPGAQSQNDCKVSHA